MQPLEKKWFRSIREKLLSEAEGDVLEIGCGTGINFSLYRDVHSVTAIDPNPLMMERSAARLQQARVPINCIIANAESLPFPDSSFDTVVATLVLCSIPNPEKALQELRRVLKPNGKALFFEHVAMEIRWLRFLQDMLTPLWRRVCDGCHLNRHSQELIQKSGFRIVSVNGHWNNLFLEIRAEK
ncbi:methyltransferase family protein [Effusibacillus lacus]|nr:methyltransferase family protein [Effusibacillus lacus]